MSARLALKPAGPATGYVDGAWWPRSDDLATELPDLMTALGDRIGTVERVSYNLAAWGTAPRPRRITVDHRTVKLAGYRSQDPATIIAIAANARLVLLVVPPTTEAGAAEAALRAAGTAGNRDAVSSLLAGSRAS